MMSDCIFCKIVQGDIPAEKVYEDEEFIVFADANPQAPVHHLVIPRDHISDLLEVKDKEMLGRLFAVIQKVALQEGLAPEGFRVVNNCGEKGGQTVGHLHFHLLGGRFMEWPPG